MINKTLLALSALALTFASPNNWASNFSFTGTFSTDADVRFISFSLLADSTDVVIETLSLNGGSNAAGDSIASGGFDPYLAIFNQADGTWIHDTSGKNGGDEARMAAFGNLLAGHYVLALTEYDNVAAGFNLADGFAADLGLASFGGMPFIFNGGGGSGHWAVDIYNVDAASLPSNLPIPGSSILMILGLFGVVAITNKARNSDRLIMRLSPI